MNNIQISIIVPVYKAEKYIERFLMSVMRQTYNHAEIECILVDDCTPDRSMELAKKIVDRENTDITFVYLRNQHNAGPSVSRNTGMAKAMGKYILFLDSDDFIMPNCIQLLMEQTIIHNDVEVVLGNFFHNKLRCGLKVRSNMIPVFQENPHKIFSLYLRDILPMTCWNVLIRRSLIEDNHLQFARGVLQEDILWSFHLYRCTTKMAFVPDVTYQYCDNEGSIMNEVKNVSSFAFSYCLILSEVCGYVDHVNYVDFMVFVLRLLFRGFDYALQPNVDRQYIKQLKGIRNTFFFRTIKDGRIVLSSAFLLLYRPLYYITHWLIYRRYYDHWINVVRIVATSFNCLHRARRAELIY